MRGKTDSTLNVNNVKNSSNPYNNLNSAYPSYWYAIGMLHPISYYYFSLNMFQAFPKLTTKTYRDLYTKQYYQSRRQPPITAAIYSNNKSLLI